MNDPIITKKEPDLKEADVIIEKHEDGSECRKCKNCACVNNKLATAGIDTIQKKEPVQNKI